MKFKLDENLGRRGATQLSSHGHDVSTVEAQGLCSSSDADLIEVCRQEGRALLSLDLDFANPLRFPPRNYAGIVVLRLPPRAGSLEIEQALETLAAALGDQDLARKLWIVELARVREYADESL